MEMQNVKVTIVINLYNLRVNRHGGFRNRLLTFAAADSSETSIHTFRLLLPALSRCRNLPLLSRTNFTTSCVKTVFSILVWALEY